MLHSWLRLIVRAVLAKQSTRALAAMMTAAALFFSDSSEMCSVLVRVDTVLVVAALDSLLSLSQMYAFLFRMMCLVRLCAIALDMGRALLTFQPAMMALCDRPPLLGY